LKQIELLVLTFCISTIKLIVQSVMYIYKKGTVLGKHNLTFLFSPFCSDIEKIEPIMYIHFF